MMFVILESEDTTKTLHVMILYDFINIIKEKSQSKSQRKVERFSLKVSKSKSKMILKSKR